MELGLDFPGAGHQPVGWWNRPEEPRRVLAMIADSGPLPETLGLRSGRAADEGDWPRWTARTRITHERLNYVAHSFDEIESLRGVSVDDCTLVEGELLLNYGGQMGAGPHPGYHSSLYMTGVTMLSLLEAAEVMAEKDSEGEIEELLPMLRKLNERFMRDDVEMFPSQLGQPRSDWIAKNDVIWQLVTRRVHSELSQLTGGETSMALEALRKAQKTKSPPLQEWGQYGRPVIQYWNPMFADAMMLGAQLREDGVKLRPIGDPDMWPDRQIVETPFGELIVRTELGGGEVAFEFEADEGFSVNVCYRGTEAWATSAGGKCTLPAARENREEGRRA
jgi:hypothetical protein